LSQNELTICGLNTVETLVRIHPEHILRLFFTKETAPRFGEVCQILAKQKKVYRLVPEEELERLSKTPHHGGVAAVITTTPLRNPSLELVSTWSSTQKLILALDGVSNSHNLGAIVRSAAFLGIQIILVQAPPKNSDSLLTPTLWRIAEGGMEFVQLWFVSKLDQWLQQLKTSELASHFLIVAADQNAPIPIQKFKREKIKTRVPLVILGNEERGISKAVHRLAETHILIPGTKRIDSLNVAHAASIIMWELTKA
jgi:TrmH RNA methyltransferase